MGIYSQSWEFQGQNSHILFFGIHRIFLRIPKSLLKRSFQIDSELAVGENHIFMKVESVARYRSCLRMSSEKQKLWKPSLTENFPSDVALLETKVHVPKQTSCVVSELLENFELLRSLKIFSVFHMTTPKFKETTDSSAILLS